MNWKGRFSYKVTKLKKRKRMATWKRQGRGGFLRDRSSYLKERPSSVAARTFRIGKSRLLFLRENGNVEPSGNTKCFYELGSVGNLPDG
ncbi:unnamed protein product [Linum trigynum]|uniref:Ribosomal protein L32 n=1 Tax=Linum trigynum TaxID=586398 RepID=A0AAV2GND8_9ROSI